MDNEFTISEEQKNANKNLVLNTLRISQRDGMLEFIDWLESTDFFEAPASTRFHGATAGGLCQHSVNVYRQLILQRNLYRKFLAARADTSEQLTKKLEEVNAITDETCSIIALLHDVCKCNMYGVEMRNKKNDETGRWEKVPAYTFAEQFHYGAHGGKSVYLIMKHMSLTDDEARAIQCHMGFSDQTSMNSVSDAYSDSILAWLLHVADEAATWVEGC